MSACRVRFVDRCTGPPCPSSDQMADIAPIDSQKRRRLTIHQAGVPAGKDPVDRRMATIAAQMKIGQPDGGIQNRKIRLAIAIQFDNRLIQLVVKNGFLP